ncbi:hypothetical protein GOBAR_DD07907 [Gossypium barbadense]|nr:hypothetical protein GOBAR_DD07907 [Gossypium barbadense]
MQEYVLGTVTELQTRPYYGLDDQLQSGKRIFHRMFWMFDPRVRVFPHYKPFVQVYGTWLYGKYTQILLLAVSQGDNKNVLPIAFAIVDKESIKSWELFLTNLLREAMVSNLQMARKMNVEVYSRHLETFQVTETIGHRPSIPPSLERTLRVWENEFSILPDLSTWEVPPTTFKLVPDKGLRSNPKDCPQSSRIRNEIDIRKKSDGKRCGFCRLVGHNRSKCPQWNYHIGQLSRSGRN